MLEVVIVCPWCGEPHSVFVNPEDYLTLMDNPELSIGQVFPYLSATEREQLISHMCPECQNEIFSDEEDW